MKYFLSLKMWSLRKWWLANTKNKRLPNSVISLLSFWEIQLTVFYMSAQNTTWVIWEFYLLVGLICVSVSQFLTSAFSPKLGSVRTKKKKETILIYPFFFFLTSVATCGSKQEADQVSCPFIQCSELPVCENHSISPKKEKRKRKKESANIILPLKAKRMSGEKLI